MLKQRSPLKLFKESMVTAMQLQPDQIRALQKFRQQIQQELAAIAAERREITLMLSKVGTNVILTRSSFKGGP